MGRFYAVARGRQTGIFTSRKACDEQTTSFPGSSFEVFETKLDAEIWLAGCIASANTGSSPSVDAVVVLPPTPRRLVIGPHFAEYDSNGQVLPKQHHQPAPQQPVPEQKPGEQGAVNVGLSEGN